MLDRYTKKTVVREIIVIVVAILTLLPFYLLISVALKGTKEATISDAVAPPSQPTLDNFSYVLGTSGSGGVLGGLVNSIIITVGSIALLVLLGSVAAYTLSRRVNRMGTLAYGLFVLGIILPFQLGLVPIYIGMRSLHLLGSQFGMIVLYAGLMLPLTVFIYTGFARALPRDYEEAAVIDGASRFQVFARVVFPLLAPATGTVAILTGLAIWNDFFVPLVFLSGSHAITLPVAIYSFTGENATQWNYIFASVIVSIIPILIFYLFAQKKFIQGFAGGMKG